MHVRKRKNKSGSTSIFVVASKRFKNKKNPQTIMVKSFGSSKDSIEIDRLCNEASKFATSTKYTPFLRINNSDDIKSCNVKNIGFEHMFGEIFNKHFSKKDMNLDGVNHQILEELVLMRIANPASKLKTSKIASDFNCNELSINKIYKFMDKLTEDVIGKIKTHVFENTKKLLGSNSIHVLFYDLTTIYFENNTASDLKKIGFSKDGKSQHVQISLALSVTQHGLPVGYEIFPGNTYEGKTLIPVLNKLRKKHNTNDVTIIADSAMLNNYNLKELAEHNFGYIVSARVKNLSASLTERMMDENAYTKLNDDISFQRIVLKNNTLVLCHSKKRSEKDEYERSKTISRLKNFVGKSSKNTMRGSLKKPYVKLSQDSLVEFDEEKLLHAKKLDGYFGFYTNTSLEPNAVIAQYRGLWQVEQTFRIAKNNLEIRPVYHYKDRRIAAHFAICFLSLSLIRTVEYLLSQENQKISLEQLFQLLRKVQSVEILNKNQKFNILTDIPAELQSAYSALKISRPKVFSVQNFDLM